MRSLVAAMLAAAVFPIFAETPCNCDPEKPETMKQRQCSLCNEAEKQPAGTEVFFLKDINPLKPNRTLALPRAHTIGNHALSDMPGDARARFWTAAIEKAKSTWGNDWAVAYNGDSVRTQCHAHVHLGKLLPGVEEDNFIVVNSIADIPTPDGQAMWIHPVNGKLHVHKGGQIAETVLLR